jgi:murein DD-endopeptidase MepM/ murein hydrolase activator NlpD
MVDLKQFDDKLKIMLDMEPGEDNTQFLGIGGSDLTIKDLGSFVENSDKKLAVLMHQSLDNLDTEIAVQSQEKEQLFTFLEERKSMFASTPSIWPTKGLITSEFAYRISPFTNEKEFHEGLDISARTGTVIIAPADGVVTEIGKTYGFGNLMTVSHGYGLKTMYGHLSSALVKKGQAVKRGDKIALVGSSGRTTGPHLHYEVLLNGVPVNPRNYLLN